MRPLFLLLFLMFGVVQHGASQVPYLTRKTLRPQLQKDYQEVQRLLDQRQWATAANLTQKILSKAPNFIDGIIMLANLQYDQGQYAAAAAGYEKALALDSLYQIRLWYQLGLAQQRQQAFAAAIPPLQRYLQLETKPNLRDRAMLQLKNAQFAAEAIGNPQPFNPEPLPETINTPAPEYWATLSADGSIMIFTRRVANQEDFYISYWENGNWQPAQPIIELNSPLNEGIHSLAADGKSLVFTACGRPDGQGGCDLYLARFEKGRWLPPVNLGPPINTPAKETQPALSADGRQLYFTSDRPGGSGQLDLWVSQRQPNGTWSVPRNLGPTLNTPEDEQAPFLHPDGRTLYFMSRGHPGMGGFDVYFSRYESANGWSVPKNLGYPINSIANEGALRVDLAGRVAYFDSDQLANPNSSSQGTQADIFRFELPPASRPLAVNYVKGKVFDSSTKVPLSATIELIDLATQQVVFQTSSDAEGQFLTCLPLGSDYAWSVQAPGYLFYSENFSLRQNTATVEPLWLNAPLQPLPAQSTGQFSRDPVVLRNVFFATGSAELQDSSIPELNRLVQLLEQNPALRIRIQGHTDAVGTAADNQKLSEERAKAVQTYLVGKGIAASRLSHRGFGATLPIAPNDTPEGRQLNRRTEFVAEE